MSPMNNRRMTPTQEPGVLDFAPGAAAAYSLRSLSLSYSGPVVTVRRSTDDAEADFTASEVSDGTLAAWCMGGDGFVKQWWDQSGNERHATASGTAQPQIVDSGVLVTEGGKAAVEFGASATLDTGLDTDLLDIPVSIFMAVRITNDATNSFGDVFFYVGGDSGITSLGKYELKAAPGVNSTNATYRVDSGTFTSAIAGYNRESMYLHVAVFGEAAFLAAVNGVSDSEAGLANDDYLPSDKLRIGVDQQSGNGTFKSPEVIIYPSDMTALRTRIEGNMAWYY